MVATRGGSRSKKVMKGIKCNNSSSKSVRFFANGGNENDIMVFAIQDGEYWFTIGKSYKSLKNAKRAAVKEMAKHGYTFDEKEMEKLILD